MGTRTAVVLAAGEGRRLRPLTTHRPKPMLPAANRPILAYVLDAVIEAGFDDLHVVVGYKRDRVQSYFGPTYHNRTLTYHVQAEQRGSGHALLQAREAVDGPFVVVNGDEVVTAGTVSDVADAAAGDAAAIAVAESDRGHGYGAVRVDGGRVTDLVEKPNADSGPFRLVNAGVYALDESILARLGEYAAERGTVALTDAVADAAREEGRVRAVRTEELWVDADYPWNLPALAEALMESHLVETRGPDEGVSVAGRATIHPDATLRAPVVVGADATVGPAAVVGPHVALGRNASVAPGAVVDRTVVDADARVGANATVTDSVVGRAARVGAGTTIAGGRTDVRVGTTIHEDVRLGAVLADRSELGEGVTVTPGVLVGADARVDAGSLVEEHVPGNARVTN